MIQEGFCHCPRPDKKPCGMPTLLDGNGDYMMFCAECQKKIDAWIAKSKTRRADKQACFVAKDIVRHARV